MAAATASRQPFTMSVTFVGLAEYVAQVRREAYRAERARVLEVAPWLDIPPLEAPPCTCDTCDLSPGGFMQWGD